MKLIICFFSSLWVFISSPSFAEVVPTDPCDTPSGSRVGQEAGGGSGSPAWEVRGTDSTTVDGPPPAPEGD